MLLVVHAAAVVGRAMVSVPLKIVRRRVQTASDLFWATASASMAVTLIVVPADRRMSSILL
jgi:hypothetical protein